MRDERLAFINAVFILLTVELAHWRAVSIHIANTGHYLLMHDKTNKYKCINIHIHVYNLFNMESFPLPLKTSVIGVVLKRPATWFLIHNIKIIVKL